MTTYTVIAGDTMWSVAKTHEISLSELLEYNPQIKNQALILPGQKLNIPNTNASIYTVMPGDTMWQIAIKHNIKLNDLIMSNPQIKNYDFIIPGQKINTPSLPSIPGTPSTPSNISALESEVINLVNVERRKNGQPTLSPNNELSNVARIKSQDFINNNYFSHNSPTYGTPFNMLRTFGVPFTAAAENVANGQRTASEVMNSWMNSSGHRSNILSPAYNQIGVGVARDSNGRLYWTQMFIRN